MKAFRRFTVRVPLPAPLSDLAVLAHNLRWVWHAPTQDLFATIDPARWEATGDPLRLLAEVSPERLTELSSDTEFLTRLTALRADLDEYCTSPQWYGDRAASSR